MSISSQQTGINSKTFFWYWRDDKVKGSGEDNTFFYGLRMDPSWSWGLFPAKQSPHFPQGMPLPAMQHQGAAMFLESRVIHW